MAQQKQVVDDIAEMLKAKAQKKEVIVGLATVLKGIQQGKLVKVFLASNSPAKMKDDVIRYATLAHIPVHELSQNNEELGVLCKKNFMVSVVGLI
ncbi:MAG: ribosomal L7Ae/L30e/S12e/Gadd45 family protein [Nanoarchaeota archaeon]|nr:ribosomal L7Ae/L30e/S12e/Gadd45 family protein [Nanoarchaeota archaeon]